MLEAVADPVLQLSGIGITRTFRCVIPKAAGEPSRCTVVASGLNGANGITISPDRKTVFVNQVASKKVAVFARRQGDGSLEHLRDIKLLRLVDNIEYDAEAQVLMAGSISYPMPAFDAMHAMEDLEP